MKLYKNYIEPKIIQSVNYGVNTAIINFDEVMNPSLFNEENMQQVCNFIRTQIAVSKNKTQVVLEYKDWFGGKRFTIKVRW